MFVVGNFLIAVAAILGIILRLLTWLIIIRALISWVNPDPYNPIVVFLHRVTEPLLQPIRRRMPQTQLDFSPLIVILAIIFVRAFLVASVMEMGYRMKSQSSGVEYRPTGVSQVDPAQSSDELMFR